MQVPAQKNLKKWVQSGPKVNCRSNTQEGHSALLECRLAQIVSIARGLLDWDKAYLFQVFRDKDASQFISDHSTNFSKHPNLYKIDASQISAHFLTQDHMKVLGTQDHPAYGLTFIMCC